MGFGRKKYRCKYPGCNSWYYTKITGSYVNKHFYTFPRNPQYHRLWKLACNVDSSQNAGSWQICEDHFDRKDFRNETKQRLNFNAVPVAFIADDLLPIKKESEEGLTVLENPIPSDSGFEQASSPSITTCMSLDVSDLPLSQNTTVTNNMCLLQDHNYCLRCDNQVLGGNCNTQEEMEKNDMKESEKENLAKTELPKKDLIPSNKIVCYLHNVPSKLSICSVGVMAAKLNSIRISLEEDIASLKNRLGNIDKKLDSYQKLIIFKQNFIGRGHYRATLKDLTIYENRRLAAIRLKLKLLKVIATKVNLITFLSRT